MIDDDAPRDLLGGWPLRMRGVRMELVHWTILARKLHVALRMGSVDVLLSIWKGPPTPQAFLSEDGFNVKYDCRPGESSIDSAGQGALRDLARRFFGRLGAELQREGTGRSPDGLLTNPVREVQPPPGYSLRARSQGPGCGDLEFRSDTGNQVLHFRISPRDPGDPGMMLWSVSLQETGDWDPGARAVFRRILLDVLVAFQVAFTEGIRWEGTGEGGPDARDSGQDPGGCPSSVRIDLGVAEPDFRRALDDLAGRPQVEEVHLEVPTRCALRCVFCPICETPPSKPDYEADPGLAKDVVRRVAELSSVLAGCHRVGSKLGFVLYGHDVLAFPEPWNLMSHLMECHPSSIGIVSPGTGLADPAFVARLASTTKNLYVNLTVLGPDAELHDRIAGRKGAFRELLAAIRNCRDHGIPVELNVVVVSANQDELARLLEAPVLDGCRKNLLLFNTEPQFSREFVSRNIPSLGRLREILEGLDGPARARVNMLVDFPWCVLPEWARGVTRWPSHTLADPPTATPAACSRCRVYRNPCPGPSNGYLQACGEGDLVPGVEAPAD